MAFGVTIGCDGKVHFSNEKFSAKRNKGESLIEFPNDFIDFDLETTGLDPYFDEIIEIGALKCANNTVVDSFSQLIKPENEINEFITSLTGISNDMVSNSPSIRDVLPQFIQFVGDSTLLGHCVNFDINFIYDKLFEEYKKGFINNFIDTYRLSRKILPNIKHHRLKDLVQYYHLSDSDYHRSLADCKHTLEVYLNLKENVFSTYNSIEEFKCKTTRKDHSIRASDIESNGSSVDEAHPLFGKVCVFTGVLEKMNRKDAMQLVSNIGGVNSDNVTKKTNYLILGNNDYCKTIVDGKSSKQKKAEQLILDGLDLQIITENVFYDMFEL